MTGEVIRPAKPKDEVSASPYKKFKPETFVNPMTGEEEQTTIGSQVIIKKDRGLAYYVGFALLVVLSFAFFFMPVSHGMDLSVWNLCTAIPTAT